jgi:asparagine synthase (glutamine-hydrolysing)
MCGFAGVVAWDDRYRVDRETLQRMSARIAHRGPDGEGLYLNHEQEATPDRPRVGLAFRRLAIIDPNPRANQPFTDGEGRWLVYNGEIYNFRELRAELKKLKPDYEWRTQSDTEVLLVAYGVWGENCVEHLNGMFAFAVWDGAKGQLFLARDRMGQKPLYYAFKTDGKSRASAFAFASELPALREVPWVKRDVDGEALTAYLRWGCVGGRATIHEQVEKLEASEWFRASPAGIESTRYYEPGTGDSPTAPPPGTARDLVLKAVDRQLVSDVPIGCFLSGGVDSSVVAAGMVRAARAGRTGEVNTFCVGFDDARYDETGYAAEVAQHLGTRHHEFRVRPDAAADLPKLAAAFGEPFGDSSALPTHYLARETRRHVKVALSGDGGDELFGGYDRYRAMQLGRRLPRAVRTLAGAGVWQRLPGSHPKSRLARLKRLAHTLPLRPGQRYAGYLSLFDDRTVSELLSGRTVPPEENLLARDFDFLMNPRGLDVVQAALAVDRGHYLPDDLLTKVDRAAMLHALEVRSPYMDHELVTFAATLTTDQLLKGGPKRMLREAFAQDLPAWVFKRKKMGFAVPIGEWFRGELRPLLRDYLFAADSFARDHFQMKTVERLVEEHETQRVDHSQRLYALLMLELWWRGQRST